MFDKQNMLTFHNITQTMKINKSRKKGLCQNHQDRKAKYRARDSQHLLCPLCATQEAHRGVAIEDLVTSQVSKSSHTSLSLLQDVYQQEQENIRGYIKQYNFKYQRLLEAVTDMQIRDLSIFNRKIEENSRLYKKFKESLSQSWDKMSLINFFSYSKQEPIFVHLDDLIKEISTISLSKSYRKSQLRSRMNSPLTSKHSSPLPLSKNGSQNIDSEDLKLKISNNSFQGQYIRSKNQGRHSFSKSQANTGSFQSKNSVILQSKKSVLQDTPESVKNMVNQNGIRVTNDMATTMFEKIDICESIDVQQEQKTLNEKGSNCSLRPKKRYEDNEE